MKLINQVKKHGRAVTLHLKRHHKKYIFGILSVSLFVKGISLIVAHTLVHNLSFANILTGDDTDSIINAEFDDNELTENLDGLTDGSDTKINSENIEGGNLEESENSTDLEESVVTEKPENSTDPEEPIVDENPEEPENSTDPEEPVVSENPEEPENLTDLEESVVTEDPENSTDPEESVVDENSKDPENSTDPEGPIVSEDPEEPENSTDSEEPIVDENPEEPTADENSDDFVATRGLVSPENMSEELEQDDEYFEDENEDDYIEDENEDDYIEDDFFDDEWDDDFGEEIEKNTTKNNGNISGDLTIREKAFQEVAYAYYMRGPYIHYNSAKGRGHDFSPEEATSQDYNYLACGLYVLNVYRQLLGHLSGNIITFPYGGGQSSYAKYYVGKRPEVIGYGRRQTSGVDSGFLYWWDGTTQYSSGHNIVNPDKSYIISQLKIGDIFGYEGHVTMVYDYKYDENGNIEDVYLIHSTHGPQYRVYSKLNLGVTVYDKSEIPYDLSMGYNKYSAIRYNYLDRKAQSEYHPDARVEGTVQLNTMSNMSSVLKFNTGNYASYYLILRFVTDDGSGNSILSINGKYSGYYDCSGCTYVYNNKKIDYSDVVQSRLKYNKLYTEKTVDKWDNSVVGVDDELTYTIKIQNNSNKAYDDDLIVKENIDTNLVEYLSYNYTKNGILVNDAQLSNNGNQLQWNIGKLNSGDEVMIEYTVKVKTGHIGEMIESTGLVDNIPSGILTNTIGKNTDKGENLKNAYNDLKNDFTGKYLINEIYRNVYGVDLQIDKIAKINTTDQSDTGGLIYYNNEGWRDAEMRINKKSPYSGMVLNGYFNVLKKNINDAHAVIKSGDEITITRYGFPAIAEKSKDIDNRADTIFPGNFQTGDILIYKNGDDLYYNWKTSPGYVYVVRTNTYENGEYAYIYIDGKFVGVNLGNDLIWTGDDRNEFTTGYYRNVGIKSRYYKDSSAGIPQNIPSGFENWLHYQSLFGKEAYVILRPSLMIRSIDYELDGGINNDENPTAFILGGDVELNDPVKDGYTFQGWYTDSEYTNQVNNTSELPDDVVLYAKWRADCTFQGLDHGNSLPVYITHGNSLTVYSASEKTCPNTCISGTVTCDNGTLLGDTGYTNFSCNILPIFCDESYMLTSTGANGIYYSCTPYTASSNSCIPGTTAYKLTDCANGYHTENGSGCTSNTKMVSCTQSGRPENSSYVTGNVQVTWNGTWNNGSWSMADNCTWVCNSGYTKVGNGCIHELTTFEKAFQEVAYAYYMRGPYIHYNVAKGIGNILSPEESTSQEYHHMACAIYVMNVYKELLGLYLTVADEDFSDYANTYKGQRKEVIGYGELQTSGVDNGSLYWYDGSKNESGELNVIKDPTQSYVISQLKIGDILHHQGHVMLVYDYVYDENGNIVDVYLINSTSIGNYMTKMKANHGTTAIYYDKNGKEKSLKLGYAPWSSLYFNYRDRRGKYEDSKIEGTILLETLKERADRNGSLLFDKSNQKNNYKEQYSILRFVDTDTEGNSVLNFYGKYSKFKYYKIFGLEDPVISNDQIIDYPDSVKSRLKYSKLYIEKTVDKKDNNTVEQDEELIYKIVIKNESKGNYEDNLIVKENIDINLVEYLEWSYTKNGTSTDDIEQLESNNGNQLQWNIGKLNSGDEVMIEYKVKVKTGHIGETIESTGLVDNIPSGIIKNKIVKTFEKQYGTGIVDEYAELKIQYTGKTLINELYKNVYGVDLELGNFNIQAENPEDENGLIVYNQKYIVGWDQSKRANMYINKSNKYSGMVLNDYFNTLYKSGNRISRDDVNITLYLIPGLWTNPDGRANTIYPTDFKTGDILIYTNENDVKYSLGTTTGLVDGKVVTETKVTPITYENGEYAYIYIDGKFVGVNLGNDLIYTGDNRNEFTKQYYLDINIDSYSRSSINSGETPKLTSGDVEFADFLRYQSLFGKDAYVVLRPSLMIRDITYELDGGTNNDENPNSFILGRDVELKEPRKTGYVFSGWYTDSEYTNQVTNTNELTDDVVLYAKWENSIHELTTFEKAFQEVAYAYYMRGPYMHYNAAKSMSDILSPEESTSQDYHYMTCTPYVMNVYKELLGIVLTSADEQYGTYARDYVGIRPEVIGYGEKSGANLYWWDGTTQYSESPQRVNPDQSYIISQLKIGDILYYAGHTMLVYDYVYSGNDIVDVYLLHSWQANYVTRTKADHSNKEKYYNENGEEVGLKLGNSQRSRLGYNYRDRIGIYPGLSRVEGTVILERLREHKYLTFTQPYESKYSILRLVTTNSSGEDLLNFNGQWTGGDQYNTKKFLYYGFLALGTGPDTLYEPDNSLKTFNNQIINNYSDSVQSRLKYSKLYIEKTVDKKDNNIVEPDDELTYKIMIKNESKKNYEDNLVVRENIDTNLVEYLSRTSTSDIQLIPNNENQLQRNIGKLDSGNEVKIEYTVKVKTGHIGETIESTGLVDNIPSGIVKNKIGKNTDKGEELKESFNNLSDNYTGKILINKIYREVYGVDLGLNGLIMTGYINRDGTIIEGQSGLIFYTKTGNAGWNPKIHNYMYINPEHPFSGMVLNNYFNALRRERYSAIGDTKITLYEVPTLLPYKNPDNRANTIYPTDFKTGDILIYINENDVKYTTGLNSSGDKINKEIPITYEDGEYAYIYMDGKFMGVNLGNDGVKDQKTGGDDRNEFGTVEYHVVNKVDSYKRELPLSGEYRETENSGCRKEIHESYCIKIPNDELKEFLRYQTLFGKDAYVILRPSLMIRDITYELDGGTNNDENPNSFILGRDIELKEPTKTGYVFSGWYTGLEYTNQVTNTNELTDDAILYAKWENTYTVTWKNRDGTVLETDEDVEYGSSPEYNGSIPTRTGDAQYSYTFYGWSPTTGVVQGDQTYTAQYTTSINEYLITFKNYDGSILETGIVVYGETPTYNGNTPSKEGGYEFSGWTPTIHPVNGIQVYTAMFRDIQGPTGEIIVSYLSGYLTNGCTSGNITLTLTGSDINGLATEPYKRDEGLWTTNSEKTFSDNVQGTGYIKDVAGNVTPIPYNITGISKTGLAISLDSPENGSILTGFVKLERAASIINPTCQALSGGYNIIVYSGTEEIYTGNTVGTSIDSTFQDGTYTWKVYANDILGHTSTSDIWTFIINSQAPTCDIDYTPAESLGWTSGDVQSILTGCSQGTTGFNATGYLFTGNGTYEFTFKNELGITGNKIAHVRRIDKIPPYLQEVTPIGTTTDTTPNYTFSSTESGSITYSGVCRSTTTQAISGNNTITRNALAVGTYSGCAITVTDKAGNISNVLNISEFTIRSSGGGGSTLKRDKCPGGDFSDSYYDGICENNRKNTHNAPNTDNGSPYQRGDEFIYDKQIFDAKYSDEMNQAYQFAYYYGITTKNSISAADMNGSLTRVAMAKMLSQYAINVLGKEPDNTRQNTFVDVSSKLDSDYSSGVTLAYQLGIMGINMKDNKFRPYDTVSRAEFVTALSRLLYGIEDGKDKYYSTHMNLLKYLGIITNTDPTMKELRGYVMLMLMRSAK